MSDNRKIISLTNKGKVSDKEKKPGSIPDKKEEKIIIPNNTPTQKLSFLKRNLSYIDQQLTTIEEKPNISTHTTKTPTQQLSTNTTTAPTHQQSTTAPIQKLSFLKRTPSYIDQQLSTPRTIPNQHHTKPISTNKSPSKFPPQSTSRPTSSHSHGFRPLAAIQKFVRTETPTLRLAPEQSTAKSHIPNSKQNLSHTFAQNNFHKPTLKNTHINKPTLRSVPLKTHSPHKFAPKKTTVIRTVIIGDNIKILDLALQLAIQAHKLAGQLREYTGKKMKPGDIIDGDTATLITEELGHNVTRTSSIKTELVIDKSVSKKPRAPIVTIAGHVDHGKTTTLDTIRKTKVAAGEFGGITQSIGAYQVVYNNHPITFIDTPGHLAFTKMRARGIALTDIAILIVAADSGIQEQTIESIKHIQNANTPTIVAINKCDAPGANPEKIKHDLLQYGIIVEDMGGDVIAVEISAKTGKNIDKLLEAILFQAEILELTAAHDSNAIGIVLEAEIIKGLGPVITIILNHGKLKVGDAFIVGEVTGKVRSITDDTGAKLKEAITSQPVRISGISALPKAGDELGFVESESVAREMLRERSEKRLNATTSASQLSSLLIPDTTRLYKFLIKANTHGALESLKYMMESLSNDTDKVQVVYEGIGDLSASDVELANTTKSRIILFNIGTTVEAKALLNNYKTHISDHKIIYKAVEYVQDLINQISRQEELDTPLGEAEVIQIFNIPNIGYIIGSRMISGKAKIGDIMAFYRRNNEIYRGVINSIHQNHQSIASAEIGGEYGFIVKSTNDIMYKGAQVKDKVKFYKSDV